MGGVLKIDEAAKPADEVFLLVACCDVKAVCSWSEIHKRTEIRTVVRAGLQSEELQLKVCDSITVHVYAALLVFTLNIHIGSNQGADLP